MLFQWCQLVEDEQKNQHALFPRQIDTSLPEAFWGPGLKA
jgi:hypothetical protein